MADVEVDVSGPLFDGRALRALGTFLRASEDEVAEQGARDVLGVLAHVLRHPSGYYESRITTDRAVGGALVTDGDVVYGPWLEGVGSRNKTTRFKGYQTFRKVTQRLESRAGGIAERVLPRFLREMN